MALNTRFSLLARNTQLDAFSSLANGGFLRIYEGAQPADPDTTVEAQVLLAELRFSDPAFGPATAGVITANTITDDAAANATGSATWFRVFMADGMSALFDGSVGTSGANLNLNSVDIQVNARVQVTALTHMLPMQGT